MTTPKIGRSRKAAKQTTYEILAAHVDHAIECRAYNANGVEVIRIECATCDEVLVEAE